MKKSSNPLVVLTAAALSLPGMVPKTAHAQSAPEKYSMNYRFTQYQEEDQSGSTTDTGEGVERYDIEVHQVDFVAPVSSVVSLKFDVSTETMSGASPWFVRPNLDGKAVQVMSGATIEESRDEYGLSANFYHENKRVGLGFRRSTENDYDSNSLNLNASVWLNGNNTTIDVGFSFSDDTVTPTQAPFIDPNRVQKEEKNSESLSITVSQIVNKTLLVGGGLTYANYDGFLSDPYKLTFVENNIQRDNRPDRRSQVSIDLNLRKYFEKLSGALHTDYRFYDNSWGVSSHTLAFGWYQNFNTWQLSTRLRLYDQTAANFYRNFYQVARADGYYSSDYRLSAFGATSYRIALSKNYDFGVFTIAYENYNSGEGFDSDNELNPGLVDFSFFTLGFDYNF